MFVSYKRKGIVALRNQLAVTKNIFCVYYMHNKTRESLEGITQIVSAPFRIQPAAYLARYARLARITYLSLLVAPATQRNINMFALRQ